MSNKNGIGYSSLTDKVYLGKQNKEKGIWIGEKQDITGQFLDVSFVYFQENSIRNISTPNEKGNLFINIKNDKKSIQNLIVTLNKKLTEL